MAFKGIRHKDRWVARSLETQPINTYLSNYKAGGYTNTGSRAIKTDEHPYCQIEIIGDRLQLGTGSFINYGKEGETAEQLRTAMEFNLGHGVALPDLAGAYKTNIGRSLWTKSDEDGSFSREAEKSYVKAGLTVWFYPPHRTDNPAGGWSKEANNCLAPMLQRVKALGGKVDYLPLN
jgi:hypothetical protein